MFIIQNFICGKSAKKRKKVFTSSSEIYAKLRFIKERFNFGTNKSSKRALPMQLAPSKLGDSGFETNPPWLAVNEEHR